MLADILSIGDELTSGQTVNHNAAWLGEQLQLLGIRVRRHLTVGDELDDIVRALQWTHKGCDVLLISGGLGPTADDLTREALAAAMQEKLVTDADSVQEITAFFNRLHRPMPAVNLVQAMRPVSARCISNVNGTAPGIAARWGKCQVFAMPGVPREMKAMFTQHVVPVLATVGAASVLRICKLNTFGLGESTLGDRIRDLMQRGANPSVGTTVHDGIVSVRIYARGSPAEADALIKSVATEVTARLGDLCFSINDEPLESVLVELLRQRRQSVATAESCTGGWVAELLTSIPGASVCFPAGWVTYSNAAKTRDLFVEAHLLAAEGAVSQPVAAAMANAARQKAGTHWGISITGIAGPEGGSAEKPVGLVFIGLAGPDGVDVRKFHFPGVRAQIRLRAAQMAMTMLRLKIIGRTFEDVIPS